MLEDFSLVTDMILRHNNVLHRLNEPRCNSELGFRAFEKSAPRLYNKLPENVKNSENINVFKKKLKTYLFNECYDLDNKIINYDYRT